VNKVTQGRYMKVEQTGVEPVTSYIHNNFNDHFPGLPRLAGGLPKVSKEIFRDCWSDRFYRLHANEANMNNAK